MQKHFLERGFLPEQDPAQSFSIFPELAILDELGHDLPSLLYKSDFRQYLGSMDLPEWPEDSIRPESINELRLYYVRIGFLASAYVNQVGQDRAKLLPANISVPLCKACRLLNRPPILSYDGYALYNWKRFRPRELISLGNIDTIQNFVHLYDEHWFILVHVEIEAIASRILQAIHQAQPAIRQNNPEVLNESLQIIAQAVWEQVKVLRRIPEHMDPRLYYRTFRPYIRFFENVVYEGVTEKPVNYRGETGAQSSILPTLVAFLKIPHQPSVLTNHLADMRRFMPAEHRALIEEVEAMPPVRELADKHYFNEVLEAIATFREVHFGWAQEYIHKWADDPRGTGGTPYMKWLQQLINETRGYMIA